MDYRQIKKAALIERIEALEAKLAAMQSPRQLLDESDEHIRALLNHVPALVWEVWSTPEDPVPRHGFMSGYLETMLGYTIDEWLSEPNFWLQIVHPDDKQHALTDIRAVFEGEKNGPTRFRIKAKDGRVLWVENHLSITYDATGKPLGARGLTVDVTERHWADLRRKIQLAAMRALTEATAPADAAQPILAALCEDLGWDIGELWCVHHETPGIIRRAAGWHAPETFFPAFDAISANRQHVRGKGLAGTAWETGHPIWIESIADDPRVTRASAAADDGLSRAFAYPVQLGNETLGVLTFYGRGQSEECRFQLLQTVTGISSQLAQFMDRHRVHEALRISDERFHNTLDNMMEGFQTIGFDWTFLYLNRAAAANARCPKEQLLGRRLMDAFPGIEHTDLFAELAHCMEKRESRYIEDEFTYPDGSTAWFSLGIQPVPDGIFVLSLDITEKKRAEQQIRALNQVLLAVREIDELMLRERDSQRLLSQACEILVRTRGYRLAWIGQPDPVSKRVVPVASAGVHADYPGDITITWDRKATGLGPIGTALRKRETSVCQDTETCENFGPWRASALERGYGSVAAVPLIYNGRLFGAFAVYGGSPKAFNPDELQLLNELAGNLAFALQSIEDEHQRNEAEIELRRSESQLRILSRAVEQSPASVVITDTEGNITYVNPKFTNLTGYTLDEVLGKNPRVLKSGHTPESTFTDLWETLVAGNDWHGEFCNVKKNGELYWESAVISPVKDEHGRVIHYIAIKEDITERRRLEQEVLDAIENEQHRFGQDLHDDLCQNLAGLQFLSSVLARTLSQKSEPNATEAHRISEGIRDAIERARLLARGLSPLGLESCILADALRQLAENSARLFQIHCTFRSNFPVEIENVAVATHLYRIVQESIANAVRHGQATRVSIRFMATDDACVLAIEDDGSGFSKSEMDNQGMGLRVMKHRANMIGATLAIRSAPGQGTTVACSMGRQLFRENHN